MTPCPRLRWLLHLPAAAYGLGLGRILGHRFLLLVHRGRRSGRRHRTLLEVVSWDPTVGEAVVMSGFGRTANWYLNVLAGGAEEVRISRDRFAPVARRVEADEGVAVIAGYERRNPLLRPVVRAVLSRLAGFRYDGSDAGRRRLLETLPLVALRRPAGSRPSR